MLPIESENAALAERVASSWKMVKQIHDKRLESELAHAVVKSTGKSTGRIKFAFVRTARRLARASIKELKTKLGI